MEKILVAVDGSPQADNALKMAVEVAEQNQAQLYVVQIIDDTGMLVNSPIPIAQIIDEVNQADQEAIEKKLAAFDYPHITSIIEVGEPKKMLAKELPEKYGIDLIIMGSTGKDRITRALIGSTTSYVINHSDCNVLMVR